MDKDIKKLLSVILLAAAFIGGPITYFLYQYEKTVEIRAAEKITLPEEELDNTTVEKEPEGNIVKEEESVVGQLEEPEDPVEETEDTEGVSGDEEEDKISEEEAGDEKPLIDDGKEGLIVNNTRPDYRDPDTPSINIGPTTGKMGSIVNAHDPSGFKQEMAEQVYDMAGKIKTNPGNVRAENSMKYYSDKTDEKRVQQVIGNLMENTLSKGERKMLPPESFRFDGDMYLITTMDTWVLETPYDNPEGILNEIKIEEPGFLQVAFFPELDSFSYNYGEVKIYFDTEKDKNVVMMVLYNFVKLNKE